MDIIVRGEPREIDFVLRICRDKVARGVLAISSGTAPAPDDVVKLMRERDETREENERLKERVKELEERISISTQYAGVTSEPTPVDPLSADTANNDAMDDKYIDTDDMHEVDLDADDKAANAEDSKEVQVADSKEATPEKKSKRNKK